MDVDSAEAKLRHLVNQYETVLEFHLANCPVDGHCTLCAFFEGILTRLEEIREG